MKHPTGSITPGQNKPRSNDSEGVLHTPQISCTGISPSNAVKSRTQGAFLWGLPFC